MTAERCPWGLLHRPPRGGCGWGRRGGKRVPSENDDTFCPLLGAADAVERAVRRPLPRPGAGAPVGRVTVFQRGTESIRQGGVWPPNLCACVEQCVSGSDL